MKTKRAIAAALTMLGLGSSAASAATNLSGSYVITVTGHPAGVTGQTLCATLVEDGSTLNFTNSGTIALSSPGGTPLMGRWFTRNFAATFEVSAGSSFIVFSGVLGHPQIQGTSFIEVVDGTPVVGGNFVAVKGTCPTPE